MELIFRLWTLCPAILLLFICGCGGTVEVDGSDGGLDAGYDAGIDAGSDAGYDAGSDAGSDPGFDAGHDAGQDAGADEGPVDPVCGDTTCSDGENSWHCPADCDPPTMPEGFAGVVWLHTDVSGWTQTANLGSVTREGGLICLNYDKANEWPGVDHVGAFVNANPWIFIYQDGVLYAATWEWMRHGQTCKNASSVAGNHIKQNPLWEFAPQSGHYYGFMVSGLARDGTRNVLERSNVILYQWP